MNETTTRRREIVGSLIRVLVAFNAVTFLLGAVAHLGVRIPLGFATIAEPQIIPATIVEGLCGLLFVVSAYAVFTRRTWAWPVTVAAHAFSLGGVLLGIGAIALGGGPRTELNDIYHQVMVVLLVVGLSLLVTSSGRTVLGRIVRA
jgi:hypothetical protein